MKTNIFLSIWTSRSLLLVLLTAGEQITFLLAQIKPQMTTTNADYPSANQLHKGILQVTLVRF
jgi:hypothetical protein